MKRKALFFILFLFTSLVNAQITFQKTISGSNCGGKSVIQAADGGYVITGNTANCGLCYGDMYLAKTDVYGNLLWTRFFGDTLSEDGQSVKQTNDGGYIIAGNTGSFGATTLGAGFGNFLLLKTDYLGNYKWSRMIGSANGDFSSDIELTSDGGFIIAGSSLSFGAGFYDVCVVKTDSAGNIMWTKTYGGTHHDFGRKIRQTDDGGFIICGSSVGNGNPFEDVYLIKTDSIGNPLWQKSYGGTDSDFGYDVIESFDGGYTITGTSKSFTNYAKVYMIKTNNVGDTLWTRIYGGSGGEFGYALCQNSDSGYTVLATSNSFSGTVNSPLLFTTDANGNMLWSKVYDNNTTNHSGFSLCKTNDNGFILTGNYQITFTAPDTYLYLIKTDSLGNSGCFENDVTPFDSLPGTVVTDRTYPDLLHSMDAEAVTPNADTVGFMITLCSTGIATLLTNVDMKLFPNPSNGKFTLLFQEGIVNGTIEIYSAIGQLKYKENLNMDLKKEFNLINFEKGLYIVNIIAKEKKYVSKLVLY